MAAAAGQCTTSISLALVSALSSPMPSHARGEQELRIVEVEFIAGDEEIERLLALVRTEGIRVFYARMPAAFGIINPDSDDPLGVSADK